MCRYASYYGEFEEIGHLPSVAGPVSGFSSGDVCKIFHLHSFEEFPPFGRGEVGSPMAVLCVIIASRYEPLPEGGVEVQELVSFHNVPEGTVYGSSSEGANQSSIATLVACRCSCL